VGAVKASALWRSRSLNHPLSSAEVLADHVYSSWFFIESWILLDYLQSHIAETKGTAGQLS
jgi:hypothetical protein